MTRVVVGVGLTSAATMDNVRAAIETTLSVAGLAWEDVATIASTTRRRDHPGLLALIAEKRRLVLFEPSELAGVSVPNPSPVVGERAGTASVAEAAALLASGAAVLLVPKHVYDNVTVAVATVAAPNFRRTGDDGRR